MASGEQEKRSIGSERAGNKSPAVMSVTLFTHEIPGIVRPEVRASLGNLGMEIAAWQERGLGKLFGFTSPHETSSPVFHPLLYALPSCDIDIGGEFQRVLLLAPGANGWRHVIAAPATFSMADYGMRTAVEKGFNHDFNEMFQPSTEPHVFHGWDSGQRDPFSRFLMDIPVLTPFISSGVQEVFSDESKKRLVEHAVGYAESLAVKREQAEEGRRILETLELQM